MLFDDPGIELVLIATFSGELLMPGKRASAYARMGWLTPDSQQHSFEQVDRSLLVTELTLRAG